MTEITKPKKSMGKKSMGKKGPGKKLGAVRRKAVDVSATSLVELTPMEEGRPLPLVARPTVPGVDLIDWVSKEKELINKHLLEHAGILFRGFQPPSIGDFEKLVEALSGSLLRYTYRSTPRSEVEGKIYTSTEYPHDQHIPLHNEMAYSRSWPQKIWFYCVTAAPVGGETPFADSRQVYRDVAPAVRQRFEDKGVMYVRNYGGGLDLPWQNVFNTDDRSEVEAYCEKSGIEFEWRSDDRLRTRQVVAGVRKHPVTGDPLWFNQAHLFHVSSLLPEIRDNLLEAVGEDELPRNAYYGDGSPISDADLAEVRRVLKEDEIVFPWEQGDIALLDNMLAAHGRRPFEGPRKVLVGMAEEVRQAA